MAQLKRISDKGGGRNSIVKGDFLASTNPYSKKGSLSLDPLARQRPVTALELNDQEITNLYKTNVVFQNICDIWAEDMTREWVRFENLDDQTRIQLEDKLTRLMARSKFQDMIKYERQRGAGIITLGFRQSVPFKLADPITPNLMVDLEYINAISRMYVGEVQLNIDPYSINYGNVEYLYTSNGQRVHNSRMIIFQTRTVEGEFWGQPIINAAYDPLLLLDTAAWSSGQILFSLLLKILKSPNININDKQSRLQAQAELDHEFNTLTTLLLGQDDEFDFASPKGSISNLKEMYDFIWELVAAAAKMPKAHILGQQQGTITGGQFDSLNYYARIAGQQENYLREDIERLVNILFWCSDSGVGKGRIDPKQKYVMKFNPLWRLDSKTDADIRKIMAEVDKIYMEAEVISPDEVRDLRFGEEGFQSVLDTLDITEEDIKAYAKKVDQARKEFMEEDEEDEVICTPRLRKVKTGAKKKKNT